MEIVLVRKYCDTNQGVDELGYLVYFRFRYVLILDNFKVLYSSSCKIGNDTWLAGSRQFVLLVLHQCGS